MKEVWNQKYSAEEYKYGKEPNQFLKSELSGLKPGRILFIGEGEGRNAVYAATLGWSVCAVDFSEAGKSKAEKLAREFSVNIDYQVLDFSEYTPEANSYDAIGVFYVHPEEDQRDALFHKLIRALAAGGRIIFECFAKEQLGYSSGGPKSEEQLYSLEEVVNHFIDLDFIKLSREKIYLKEGFGHAGEAVVIRFIAAKTTL